MELLLAVLGILGTLAGTLLGYLRPRRVEQKEKKNDLLFSVYLKLLEVNEQYFWIASAEVRQTAEKPRHQEIRFKIQKLAWGIVNDLRPLPLTPVFQKVIRRISRVNIAAMMDRGFEKPEPRNAPGALIY